MSAVYLGTWEAGTPEWHEHRADKVGGSDVAAILGLSQWQSPYSLWQQRKGMEPDAERPQMGWGKRLEPVIIQAWADKHPDVEVRRQPGAVYAHPDRPWQVASPDALLTPDGGLEVKTARHDTEWGPDGSNTIPIYYEVQVQWSMDVFSLPTWNVAVLIAGSDYREYVVEANTAMQELLREQAREWLDSLTADSPPALDGHEETYRAVRRLHPDIDDDECDLPDDLAAEWINAMRDCVDADDRKRAAQARILDFMGRSKHAMWGGQRIGYRQPGPRGAAPFLKAIPGLLKQDVAS